MIKSLKTQEGKPPAVTPKDLIETLARQNGLAHPTHLWGNCKLYTVSEVWAAKTLAAVPAIKTVTTQLELRAALADENVETIFLPKTHIIHPEILQKLCEKAALDHVLFLEGTE